MLLKHERFTLAQNLCYQNYLCTYNARPRATYVFGFQNLNRLNPTIKCI